jgi:hypothetical protein
MKPFFLAVRLAPTPGQYGRTVGTVRGRRGRVFFCLANHFKKRIKLFAGHLTVSCGFFFFMRYRTFIDGGKSVEV